jgi:hypothetical protein
MRIIREVSCDEMRAISPCLMDALGSSDAEYCINCDGLRIHRELDDGTLECIVCGEHRRPRRSRIDDNGEVP